jgi:alpha-N-arabinofuranosidase
LSNPMLALEWVKVRTSPDEWLSLDRAGTVTCGRCRVAWRISRSQPSSPGGSSTGFGVHPPGTGLSRRRRQAWRRSEFGLPLFPGRAAWRASFRISLQEVREGTPKTLAGQTLTLPAGHVVLGIEQAGARLGFFFEPEPGRQTWLIRDVDARLLSTQVAGGFVGATIGIHALRE